MRWNALTLHELADRIAFACMSEWVKLLRLCGASMRDAVCVEIGGPGVQSQKTNSTIRKLIPTTSTHQSTSVYVDHATCPHTNYASLGMVIA